MTIEDTLRRLLDEAAPEPPAGSAPPTDLATAEPRRRWVMPLIAAAVVVALVGVLLVARAIRPDRGGSDAATRPPVRSSVVATPTPTTTASPAPSGMRVVGYYGISIAVPTSWPVGPVLCVQLTPRTDAVVIDTGEYASCPMQSVPPRGDPPAPAYTTVHLRTAQGISLTQERRTTIDGVPVRIGYDSDGDESVLVPSRGVVVSVAAMTRSQRQTVLATVHITPVDPLGCVDGAAPLVGDSNPVASELVPGRPVSAVVCEYSGDEHDSYRLLGSARLTEVQLHSLVTRVDGSSVTGKFTGFQPVLARYVFTYADGSTRTVDARLDEDPAPVTDGRRTVAVVAGNGLPSAFVS